MSVGVTHRDFERLRTAVFRAAATSIADGAKDIGAAVDELIRADPTAAAFLEEFETQNGKASWHSFIDKVTRPLIVDKDAPTELRAAAEALGKLQSVEGKPTPSRYQTWLADIEQPHPGALPATSLARLIATHALGPDATQAFLLDDIVPVGQRERFIQNFAKARFELDERDARKLAQRMRDLTNVMFAGQTHDLAATAVAFATAPAQQLKDAPRLTTYAPEVQLSSPPPFVADAIDDLGVDPAQHFDKASVEIWQRGDDAYGGFSGGFFLRSPVGAYGEDTHKAISEAANILAGSVGNGSTSRELTKVLGPLLGQITFQLSGDKALREGVATLAQVLSLVIAKAPPGYENNLPGLLDVIKDSGMLSRVAMAAPFGVIAPLALSGLVPKDEITFSDTGRPQMPHSLHAFLRAVSEARELPSIGSKTAVEGDQMRSQTLLGCPVAARGPVTDKKGVTTITAKSPLTELAAGYIDLVKRLLKDPSVTTTAVVPTYR